MSMIQSLNKHMFSVPKWLWIGAEIFIYSYSEMFLALTYKEDDQTS